MDNLHKIAEADPKVITKDIQLSEREIEINRQKATEPQSEDPDIDDLLTEGFSKSVARKAKKEAEAPTEAPVDKGPDPNEAIVSAAISFPDGEIRTGQLHRAIEGAEDVEEGMQDVVFGFLTNKGRFLTVEETAMLTRMGPDEPGLTKDTDFEFSGFTREERQNLLEDQDITGDEARAILDEAERIDTANSEKLSRVSKGDTDLEAKVSAESQKRIEDLKAQERSKQKVVEPVEELATPVKHTKTEADIQRVDQEAADLRDDLFSLEQSKSMRAAADNPEGALEYGQGLKDLSSLGDLVVSRDLIDAKLKEAKADGNLEAVSKLRTERDFLNDALGAATQASDEGRAMYYRATGRELPFFPEDIEDAVKMYAGMSRDEVKMMSNRDLPAPEAIIAATDCLLKNAQS